MKHGMKLINIIDSSTTNYLRRASLLLSSYSAAFDTFVLGCGVRLYDVKVIA
jgi:hypothetical protein